MLASLAAAAACRAFQVSVAMLLCWCGPYEADVTHPLAINSIKEAVTAAASSHLPQSDMQRPTSISLQEHGLEEAVGMAPLQLSELIQEASSTECIPIQVANDDDMLGEWHGSLLQGAWFGHVAEPRPP